MLIKICGLTNSDTAKYTAIAGADYIGLLFSKVSPRQVSLDLAKQITINARNYGADVVGVFVDEDLEQIYSISKALGLKIIQLHGNKARAFCSQLVKDFSIIYVADGKEIPKCLNPHKDFILYDGIKPYEHGQFRFFVAGKLTSENVEEVIKTSNPHGLDLSSGVERELGVKDIDKIRKFISKVRKMHYGKFGGQYAPEILIQPLKELEDMFDTLTKTDGFYNEYSEILRTYAGRPTALTEVKNFAKALGGRFQVFLKREDLLHTGAHKINNAIGQCLIAKKMGKTRIVAETGAGQHGLATATACAMLNLECTIYMGQVDIERQAPNVAKMRLLGAKVVSVDSGSATLKDAVNEALRHWAENYDDTHYCLGSALGPYPFPKIVAYFQKVIGDEVKEQFKLVTNGKNPDMVIACVGGGSNAIGIFQGFLEDESVDLVGVEAGGLGPELGNNAARFASGTPGVLHGTYTYLLQTEVGNIVETHSISAGLDYPAVGPEHANLYAMGRARYESATDKEALDAFLLLTKTEGIIPALESAHALAYLTKIAPKLPDNAKILVNLSGRGDKDLPQLLAGELKHVTLN